MTKKYTFFQNTACEFFPCHKNIAVEDFNCMFCYCPLYCFKDCGGSYTLLENKIKDCSNCDYPHHKKNYNQIIKILKERY
jgi:Zn-finger protein